MPSFLLKSRLPYSNQEYLHLENFLSPFHLSMIDQRVCFLPFPNVPLDSTCALPTEGIYAHRSNSWTVLSCVGNLSGKMKAIMMLINWIYKHSKMVATLLFIRSFWASRLLVSHWQVGGRTDKCLLWRKYEMWSYYWTVAMPTWWTCLLSIPSTPIVLHQSALACNWK